MTLREWWARARGLFRGARLEREFDAEVEFHIAEQTDEYIRAGMAAHDARQAALRDFGGMAQIREIHRERRGFHTLAALGQDLRFGWRTLGRDRIFTAAALTTMALTIGAATAIFSIANAVLIRPLPYPDSSRLMAIVSTELAPGGHEFYSAPGVYLDWRDQSKSFETIAAAAHTTATVTSIATPALVSATMASADLLPLLGVRPGEGRLFAADEHEAVLVSQAFWHSALGSRPNPAGSKLIVDGRVRTIVGVVPTTQLDAYGSPDLWIPLEANRQARGGGNTFCIGRLGEGVSLRQAQAEMDLIMGRIRGAHVEDSKTGVVVRPLQEWLTVRSRRPFLLLCAAAALLLAIGCSNIANLLLARASAREREMSIRANLGAGPWRLARQTVVESLLLACMGGALGIPLAIALVRIVPTIEQFEIPRAHEVAVDSGMLAIAVALTVVCGLAFGLAPALQAGRPVTAPVSGNRLRTLLAAAQIGLTLILLSAAGLVTNSLWRLLQVDPGFDKKGLVTIQTHLPYARYGAAERARYHEDLAAGVSSLPGVEQVTIADYAPLQAVMFPMPLSVGTRQIEAEARHAGRGYFETIGIPLVSGHGFDREAAPGEPVPAVISASAARKLFGDSAALGQTIRTPYRSLPALRVIGVARNARQHGLRRIPAPQVYLPVSVRGAGYVITRVAANSGPLAPSVARLSAQLDPEVPAPDVSSIEAIVERDTALPRVYTWLLGSFAAIGLTLSVAGVYGLIAYGVERRRREFGIRLAIGARYPDIIRIVLASGMKLTFAGVTIGLAGAAAVAGLMRTILYEVEPGDPATLALAVLLLSAAVLAACWVAARDVQRIDPNDALRSE